MHYYWNERVDAWGFVNAFEVMVIKLFLVKSLDKMNCYITDNLVPNLGFVKQFKDLHMKRIINFLFPHLLGVFHVIGHFPLA